MICAGVMIPERCLTADPGRQARAHPGRPRHLPYGAAGSARRCHSPTSWTGRRRCAAVAFGSLGVQPGDTVVVQVPSRIEGVIAQAALGFSPGRNWRPSCPATARANWGLHPAGVARPAARDAGPVGPAGLPRRSALASATARSYRRVAVIADSVPQKYIDFRQLVNGSEALSTPTAAATDDDGACWSYTSAHGTWAGPKGVQHTDTTLLAELRTRLTGVGSDGVILAAFPSGHVAGTCQFRMLLQGVLHVVMDAWDATAARLDNEHGVTATGGTPFFLTTLLDLADEVDLSCLREYGVGGASVPPSAIERAHRHGIMAFRAYGSSEHPTISGGSSEDVGQTRTHRRPAQDGVELLRIVGDALQDLPVGTPGEILSRGPELFVGYRDSGVGRRCLPTLERVVFHRRHRRI